MVLGDFNLPSLRWDMEEPLDYYIYPLDLEFYEMFATVGLSQVVREPTNFPSCTILDLILLSHSDRMGCCCVLPPLPSCSHACILISYIFQNNTNVLDPGAQSPLIYIECGPGVGTI